MIQVYNKSSHNQVYNKSSIQIKVGGLREPGY